MGDESKPRRRAVGAPAPRKQHSAFVEWNPKARATSRADTDTSAACPEARAAARRSAGVGPCSGCGGAPEQFTCGGRHPAGRGVLKEGHRVSRSAGDAGGAGRDEKKGDGLTQGWVAGLEAFVFGAEGHGVRRRAEVHRAALRGRGGGGRGGG